MPDRYFELDPSIGLDPNGNPEPMVEVGVVALTYTVIDGEPVPIAAPSVTLKPLDGTRIVVTDDPRIADQLLATHYIEIDKPTRAQIKDRQKQVQDAIEQQGTHVSAEEAAAADAPSDPDPDPDQNPEG